jgi:hypothetical protein
LRDCDDPVMRRSRTSRPKRADYESFDDFYANVHRRGDDVRLGEVVDGEYRWRIIWLPRTREVAAFALFWTHEYLHLLPGTDGEGPAFGPIPMAVPALVNVLGLAESAEAAQRRIEAAGRTSLDALRTSLAAA